MFFKTEFKIHGMISSKEYNSIPFGRQMEHHNKLKEFKERAKKGYVVQKRKTHKQAIKEFKELYNVDEFYYLNTESIGYRDDSFEIWYTEKV